MQRQECPFSTGKYEEGRMLSKEDFMEIQALVKRGLYQKDIAEQLGAHPRTVRRALEVLEERSMEKRALGLGGETARRLLLDNPQAIVDQRRIEAGPRRE